MRSRKPLLTVLVLAFSAVIAFAQQGPLSLTQIEKLLTGGIGQERIAGFVSERGIDFEATGSGSVAGSGVETLQNI